MPAYASIGITGGVSSEIHLATIEGLKTLENGGNAFDAAITVSSVLTILMPHRGSVGGDGFLLAVDTSGEIVAYNGSGRSLKGFPADDYMTEKPYRGPLTVTVPGLVDLWTWTNENYGSQNLSLLLDTAIILARNGFYVQEPLARAVQSSKRRLASYGGWRETFSWMEAGSKARFPRLAEIYASVARKGADAFYRSQSAEVLIDELRRRGVPVTYADFAEHRGEKVTPIKCAWRDCELYELPPNTQGLSTLQLLKAIEVTELNKLPFRSLDRIRGFLNLALTIYEDRDEHVADPRYYQAPVENLLSATYLRERLGMGASRQGVLSPSDTTFFVVSDKYGNLVGFIQSVFGNFGSGITVYDIPFQNRGAGFAKKSGLPNSPAPSKRPLHTLSILLARHSDEGDYLIGCAAGDLRPQIHAEVLMNAIDYEMPLSDAVEAPRYVLTSWQKSQVKAVIEEGIWVRELADRGRKIQRSAGIVHAARKSKEGPVEFVADTRGGGVAAPLF